MHTTTRRHLADIAEGWPKLSALLPAGAGRSTWPPARSGYLRALDDHDAEAVALERAARSELSLGERPVPISLEVFDTMRTIERTLCDLADQIASEIQRPVIGMPTGDLAGWTMANVARRAKLVREDRADPRRWRYGGETRTAPTAAKWLSARLVGAEGPFRALSDERVAQVAAVAQGAAQRLGKLIGSERIDTVMDRLCPWCAGKLVMSRGGDDPDIVTCQTGADCTAPVPLTDKHRVWATPEQLAGLERALYTAEQRRRRRDQKRAERARTRSTAA